MSSRQLCPKCGSPNEPEALRCAQCRAPLVQVCPRCGSQRKWYVATCPQCADRSEDNAEFVRLFRDPPKRQLNKRYAIQEIVSQGAVSAVYRCQDTQSPGQSVIIKELAPTALFRAQERRSVEQTFWASVARWQALEHPALVRILDSFAESDRYYVVLSQISGLSWHLLIADTRWHITPTLAANWGLQLCQLMSYLHAQPSPMFLPFLAPQHVMVSFSGQVQVIDYGLKALFAPNDYGPYGSVSGYAAPGLESEPPTPASDIFSLGRLLYALLTGRLLEQGTKSTLPLRQAVPEVSEGLARAIARAAQRDLVKRFQQASEFAQAIRQSGSNLDATPLADWIEGAMRSHTVSAAVPARMVARAGDSMADLGFMADPRYGVQASSKTVKQAAGNEPIAIEKPISSAPQVSINPRNISLQDIKPNEVKRVVLTLHNAGAGDAEGRLRSNVAWLKAPERLFQLASGKTARAIITISADQLPPGKHLEPQALAVETNSGRMWVSVTSDIATGPQLRVPEPLLDFGVLQDDAEKNMVLLIENLGRGVLTGVAVVRVPWVRVLKPEFRCGANASTQLSVSIQSDKLPSGLQQISEGIVIDSNGGQERIAIRAWRQRPELELNASAIDFGAVISGQIIERYLIVGNKGDGLLEGTVRSLLPNVQVHPQQFSCAPGELVQLTLSADCANLSEGNLEISQALRFQTNGGNRTLALRVQVKAPRLRVETPLLDFGEIALGQTLARKLMLFNDGSAPLELKIESLVPWLSVEPTAASISAGSNQVLDLAVNTTKVGHGLDITNQAGLRLSQGTGILVELPLRILVPQPALSLDCEQVDFGYIERTQPASRQVTIQNTGTGNLAWQAQSNAIWLEVNPTSGSCASNQTQLITLTAYGLALAEQQQAASATLVVNSDGGRGKIEVRVGIAKPILATDTTLLELTSVNHSPAMGTFRIFNHGLGDLNGTLTSNQTWLVPDRVSFQCPTGHSIEISISTDMAELSQTTTHTAGTLQVITNGGSSVVEVTLDVILAAQIKALPAQLVFEKATSGEQWESKLGLQNAGEAPAHVVLHSSSMELVLKREVCDIKPGKTARVSATWNHPEPPLPGEVRIEVTSGTQVLQIIS